MPLFVIKILCQLSSLMEYELATQQVPPLLTWINFNLSMDKESHTQ